MLVTVLICLACTVLGMVIGYGLGKYNADAVSDEAKVEIEKYRIDKGFEYAMKKEEKR